MVLFDGVMVDIPKARAVLAKLGLLDNPEFVAERGVPLPDGSGRVLTTSESLEASFVAYLWLR